MARKRNPKRDEAYRIWIESNKEKLLKDIANELDVSASTIRKWKSQDNWDRETKRSAPNEKERYDSMRGNQNAKGNKGGPPPDNKNAVSHGLFSKWLPDETRQIMAEFYTSEPQDIIWNNIIIQYTAIIRSQKIMFVQDEHDTTMDVTQIELDTKVIDFETMGPPKKSETRQYQYAWDKQANFLAAQSRAMGTLSNLMKQFVALADEKDERRIKLEMMNAKLKLLDLKAKEQMGDSETEDDGFLQALEHEAGDVWES